MNTAPEVSLRKEVSKVLKTSMGRGFKDYLIAGKCPEISTRWCLLNARFDLKILSFSCLKFWGISVGGGGGMSAKLNSSLSSTQNL